MKVYKFPIDHGYNRPPLSPSAKILHFGPDPSGVMCMWVLLDPDAPTTTSDRLFAYYGTGHEVPDDAQHIGTCAQGMFMWHLFELPLR